MKILGLNAKGLALARKRGEEELARSPVSARYSPRSDSVVITMPSGAVVTIPRKWMWELRDVPKTALKKLRLGLLRSAVELPDYDIHTSAMGLLRDAVFGDDHYVRAGRVKSPAKARAARRNGAKGGRPKKKARA